jgi:Flp pilus assembly protein TadG
MTARTSGLPPDEGSLTVELVALTPVLVVVAMVVLVFGRVADARQQVTEAARAGAQVAAVQATAAEAGRQSSASVLGLGLSRLCTTVQVSTDTARFVPGGLVTVSVACRVPLSDLSMPGLPGSTMVRATSTAPIDPYRVVGGSR